MGMIFATSLGALLCFYAWGLHTIFATRMKLKPRLHALADSPMPARSRGLWRQRRLMAWRRPNQRVRKFNEGLPEMLNVVSNSLKAGHSFAQALHLVADDLDGPIQTEVRQVEHDVQVGLSMEDALARASERVGSEDFELVVIAIQIQRQVGGNLAEVLDKVAQTVRDRLRMEREVKMLTAQGRLSGTIFMVLPLAIGVLLYLVNAAYMNVMFHSALGLALLAMAALGQAIGFFLIRRIVRVSL